MSRCQRQWQHDQCFYSSGFPVAAGGKFGEKAKERKKKTCARQRKEGRQVEKGGEGVQPKDQDEPGRRGRRGRWQRQTAPYSKKASEDQRREMLRKVMRTI